MILQSDFNKFLQEIRPTKAMRDQLIKGHKTLRERLNEDEELKPILVSDFLQGSYRRYTAVRPKGDKRSDVDLIIVTKLDETEYTPKKAMALFEPFLNKHYRGKWRPQGRSFGIEMSYVDLDIVPTSAPARQEYGILQSDAVTSDDDIFEARDWRLHRSWLALHNRSRIDARSLLDQAASEAEWQAKPLRIPDRDADEWDDTHPLEQIRWTRDKNSRCNGHFVNVVKCIKWWRLEHYADPVHPKGFPLERLIGEHCPDGLGSVAEGVVKTLEAIVSSYSVLVLAKGKPTLPDYGVPSHDVFKRITGKDFCTFYDQVKTGAELSRRALDSEDRTESGNLWCEMFGSKFPEPPNNGSGKKGGFTPPIGPAAPGTGRFA
ncbi:nucleotidyltransferase [Cobetia sp. QF-1]|uniref:SMODS domain-containing nucleotidyltransferase n=1 Tax=Cobetia sp. QF-1 TaxID=1969833 RepID=UPI000B53D994|nr:nucleotidyltransferase [Cobetia sp. QF-1]